jgi:hypothetical protein
MREDISRNISPDFICDMKPQVGPYILAHTIGDIGFDITQDIIPDVIRYTSADNIPNTVSYFIGADHYLFV